MECALDVLRCLCMTVGSQAARGHPLKCESLISSKRRNNYFASMVHTRHALQRHAIPEDGKINFSSTVLLPTFWHFVLFCLCPPPSPEEAALVVLTKNWPPRVFIRPIYRRHHHLPPVCQFLPIFFVFHFLSHKISPKNRPAHTA